MTVEEKIIIDITSLLEELKCYEYMNETYCTQLNSALSPFDKDKAIFCLSRIAEWFETNDDRKYKNPDYGKTQKLLQAIKQKKLEEDNARKKTIPLMQFWTAINSWINEEMQDPAELFNSKYKETFFDFGNWHIITNVDLDYLYKLTYGKPYVEITDDNISVLAVKEFLEAYYKEIIEPINGRLKFTVKVNELLSRFRLPFKLQKGKLSQSGYKTTYQIDIVVNFEQFERKIEYANEMIMHGDYIDKHCALKYIADAFCYFYSLYNNDKKLGELVNTNNNTNADKVIKDEISLIKKVINNDFDIRHNEENSARKEGKIYKRELLDDPFFIEYLYNRINSLLMLLRIKRNQKIKIADQNSDAKNDLDEDELPF